MEAGLARWTWLVSGRDMEARRHPLPLLERKERRGLGLRERESEGDQISGMKCMT